MKDPRVWHNTPCLCCGNVEEKMVVTDFLVFCNDCFVKEFNDSFTTDKSRFFAIFDKWREIYNKKKGG